jgi:hypothetical protein
MASKETVREEQLRQAAEYRAGIIAVLKKSKTPFTQAEIETSLAAYLGLDTVPNMYNILGGMFDNELIYRSKDGKSRNIYSLNKFEETPSTDEETEVTKVRMKRGANSTIKIDIVKSTGRVRIQTQGIVLEVGVVES